MADCLACRCAGLIAIAGMVSLLPTIDGRLFRIKGGNRLLPAALLERAGAKLYSHRVLHVNRTGTGMWLLGIDGADGGQSTEVGDIPTSTFHKGPLILAVPAVSRSTMHGLLSYSLVWAESRCTPDTQLCSLQCPWS